VRRLACGHLFVRPRRSTGGRSAGSRWTPAAGSDGALSDPYTTGAFGAGLLGPARVVFDYPRRRVAVLAGA